MVVALVVAADVYAISFWYRGFRWTLALMIFAPVVGLFIMKRVGHLSFAAMGLRLLPRQAYARWLRVFWITGAAAIWGAAIIYGLLIAIDKPPDESAHALSWHAFWTFHLPVVVVHAPVCEELIFRVLLCTALRAWVGDRVNVAISGVAFAAMHFHAGNAAPNNVLAGFLFAWLFLKSGSWIVPLAFHVLGNLVVGLLGLLVAYA